MATSNKDVALRDAFAARAMQGEISRVSDTARYSGDRQVQLIADKAYRYAAAMMEARKKYLYKDDPDQVSKPGGTSLLKTPEVLG